ncbi:pullulanase [Candidatus Bipolaricaulota bacterium]|nr:pullulanase [Candidatus Bipolaricaulota bacterium]
MVKRKFGIAVLILSALLLGGLAQEVECPGLKVAVTFGYTPLEDETVTSVNLRGSFNNWGEWPMEEQPDGSWSITVCLEPGTHQYKFFINGRWPRDMATARGGGPVDPEAAGYVDDGFGGQNAVRIVKPVLVGPSPVYDPHDPAYLCIADDRLVLRLRTAPGQVESVRLVTGQGEWPMERQLWWDWGEMWRISLPVFESLNYYFVGTAVDGSEFTVPDDPSEPFSFDGVDRFLQLKWVSQGVAYQIFPDRFCNGDPENDVLALQTDEFFYNELWTKGGPVLSSWSNPITPEHCCHQYFGGDLAGIMEKLDYLSELGITILYLNPIFDSGSAHGYDTRDYLKVSPKFGTEADLRRLLDEAHARGMRVIFDFVPNHTGISFWAFLDVAVRGPESPYWDWYFVREWPFLLGDGNAYEGWWGLGSLPKLNTAGPEVKTYLFDVVLHWLDFGFDGLRVDVPNEVINAHGFFSELRELVKARHPEAYMVGEIWQLDPSWVQGDQFDSLMNYALGRDVLLPYARGNADGERTLAELSRYFATYGENVAAMGFNLVSSHDTSRVLTDLGGGKFGETPSPEAMKRLKLLSTLLYALPGAPVTFQGDERGILGEKEFFDSHRYPIQWDVVDEDLLAHYIGLARMRRTIPVLTTSAIRAYAAKEGVIAFFRGHEDEVLVLVNNAPRLTSLELPPGRWRIVGVDRIVRDRVVIPPVQAWILVREE